MALSFDPNSPVPNGPFSSPLTWFVQGAAGPLITGNNISIDPILGTINATPPSGLVTSVTAGAGLTGGTITSSGTIALAPTGIAAGTYTLPTLDINSLGQIVGITANPAPGTVCTINTGAGLTGGPITSSGTIAIATTGVTVGNYPYATIDVNAQGQVTAATANTPVTSITAGTGLSGGTITSTGTLAIANTGAVAGTYALPTIAINAQGQITSATNGVAVTCITTGTGLTGGPITSTGQICLSNTGVTAGNYTLPSVSVDAQGRIGAISNGSAVTNLSTSGGIVGGPITGVGTICLQTLSPSPAGSYSFSNISVDIYGRVITAASASLCTAITGTLPVTVTGNDTSVAIGINSATTTAAGAVALTNDLTTNSATTALTAAQGYSLQQQLNALAQSTTNQVLAGTFNAFAGQMLTVTQDGIDKGFAVGSDLVAPSSTNENTYVIVTTGGTYNPPGGGGPYSTSQGDWFLSNGSTWQFLNVGYDSPAATTLTYGVVELATLAEVQAGTDSSRALTSDTVAQTYVPKSAYATKGDVLVATAASTYSALAVSSTDGQPLVACSTSTTGLAYGNVPIPQSLLTTKGDTIAADSSGVPSRFAVGTDGQVLVADSSQTLGLCWCSPTAPVPLACLTGKGALITATSAQTPAALAYSGNDGDILQVCTACATGITWAPPAGYIPCSIISGKGVVVTGTSTGIPAALPVGADGYILTACATAGTGLTWCPNPPAIPCACIGDKGAIVVGTAASTPSSIAVGTDGQYLSACALSPTGLCWITPPAAAIPVTCITGKGALITGTAADTPVALPAGANGTILYANSSCVNGLEWVCYVPAVPCACLTAKGSIIAASAASTPANFSVGTNGQVLTACSACAEGLVWATPSADIPCSLLTAKGQIIVATAADTPTALPVGSNGQVLLACTACTEGVFWSQPFIRCDEFTAKGQILGATGAGTFTALAPAAADCYWLLSCAACPNGMAWANTPSTLGDTPVGAVGFFAGVTAPNGWLVADGSAVSRTAYAALFAQIGTIYGNGDGSSTFNLPDMRGMFPRGWDAAGGTARGCDPGRVFGSSQTGMVGPHTHNLCFQAFAPNNSSGNFFGGQQGNSSVYTCPVANREATCAVQASLGTETRPVNVAMLPCIKWLVTVAPPGPSTCGIPCQCLVSRGTLVTATAPDTPTALPVGTNGQVLVANSACAAGLQWQTGAIGPWISAGTVQSVGLGATTTAPTVGTTDANNVRYRQLGAKEWEVVYSFRRSVTTGANAGSGDYLYTLPGGIQWDTTLPFQTAYNGNVGADLWSWPGRGVPSANGSMNVSDNATIKGLWIVPFDATRFRVIVTVEASNLIRPQSASIYATTATALQFNFTFQVTSP